MPHRNWSGHLAALILLVAVIWLSFWGLLEFRTTELQADEAYESYRSGTKTDQEKTADEIASKCINSTGETFRKCLFKAVETYATEDTENQDLKAQQDMARWAKMDVLCICDRPADQYRRLLRPCYFPRFDATGD